VRGAEKRRQLVRDKSDLGDLVEEFGRAAQAALVHCSDRADASARDSDARVDAAHRETQVG